MVREKKKKYVKKKTENGIGEEKEMGGLMEMGWVCGWKRGIHA